MSEIKNDRPKLEPGDAVLYDRMFGEFNAVKQNYEAVRAQWVAFCDPLGLDPDEHYAMEKDGSMKTRADVRAEALARGEDPDHRNPIIAKDGTVIEAGTGPSRVGG